MDSLQTNEVEAKQSGEELRFRSAMLELNEIVNQLEGNQLELEDALVKYERAIYLLRFLRSGLTNAQQRVDTLMGQLEESPADSVVDTSLSKA